MGRRRSRDNSRTGSRLAGAAKPAAPALRGAPAATRDVGLLAGLLVGVLLIVAVAHWPALSARALAFDDTQYLTNNALVQNPSWDSAWRFLSEVLAPSTVEGYYQPLTMISLMLDYALGGRPDDTTVFHVTSLLLHLANTGLIFALLYMLFGNVWVAALVGLLFGVHPLTVEPIPWVSERKSLLSTFFALSCVILYVRFTRRRSALVYAAVVLAYLLGLLAKPTVVPLPIVLLLMDYWPLRRLDLRPVAWRTGLQRVAEKLPLLALTLLFAWITYVSQRNTASAINPDEKPVFMQGRELLILAHNIVFYLQKVILPVELTSHYPFPKPLSLEHPQVLSGVVGSVLLIVGLGISLVWTRALATGWLIFFVAIFPTMGVVTFTNVIAADKYAYFPALGLLLVLAWLLKWLWERSGGPGRRPQRVALLALLGVLVVLEIWGTRSYLQHWQTTEAFCRRILRYAPEAEVAHMELGIELSKQGRSTEALPHLEQAVRLNPVRPKAWYNLGLAYAFRSEENPAALVPAAWYFAEAVRRAEAVGRTDFAEAEQNLLLALARLRDRYTTRLQAEPQNAGLYWRLGQVAAAGGQPAAALQLYRQALQLAPGDTRFAAELIRLLSSHPEPGVRDGAAAVQLAESLRDGQTAPDAQVLDVLAMAYAEVGRFAEAAETARQAAELATSSTKRAAIRQRAARYAGGQPFRAAPRPPRPEAPVAGD